MNVNMFLFGLAPRKLPYASKLVLLWFIYEIKDVLFDLFIYFRWY